LLLWNTSFSRAGTSNAKHGESALSGSYSRD
jgi:hypothetical protein